MSPRPLLSRDDAGAVLPEALEDLTDLRARGLTHRWVRHVRSSQAFALSLFAPLSPDGIQGVFGHVGVRVTDVDPVVFEFEDETDRLAEASSRSPHKTQVDVVLSGTTDDGLRHAVFIEVKLSEVDFGWCSAFESPDNPHRDVCASRGMFGSDVDRCFQLQNHGRGRRYYDTNVPDVRPPGVSSSDGGCWVRQGRNQPMRNLALAGASIEQKRFDRVTYALCAPDRHPTIWRRFEELQEVFIPDDRVDIQSLTAEVVAHQHPDGGTAFTERYAPALRDQALVHLSPDGSQLLGVWLMRNGQAVESPIVV